MIGENVGDNPYKRLTMDQAIGAVAGHESGYTEKENTKQYYENAYKDADHDVEAQPKEMKKNI